MLLVNFAAVDVFRVDVDGACGFEEDRAPTGFIIRVEPIIPVSPLVFLEWMMLV